jgi:hypothetical protein
MNRRACVVGLLAVTAVPFAQAEPAADPVAHVRALYEREIVSNASRQPMTSAEFESLFTPEALLLRKWAKSPPASVLAGKKLHAFFGWGMLPGVPVTLEKVAGAESGDQATVIVDLKVRGVARSNQVALKRVERKWLIINIFYDNGDNLNDFYNQLSGR